MTRRLEIELTSARHDGTWTWRAAGAREPRGVIEGKLLEGGARVGAVLRVEAEFELEGITVVSVLPARERVISQQRIELAPSKLDEAGLVTTSLVSRSERGARCARARPVGSDRHHRAPKMWLSPTSPRRRRRRRSQRRRAGVVRGPSASSPGRDIETSTLRLSRLSSARSRNRSRLAGCRRSGGRLRRSSRRRLWRDGRRSVVRRLSLSRSSSSPPCARRCGSTAPRRWWRDWKRFHYGSFVRRSSGRRRATSTAANCWERSAKP